MVTQDSYCRLSMFGDGQKKRIEEGAHEWVDKHILGACGQPASRARVECADRQQTNATAKDEIRAASAEHLLR